MSMQEGTLKPWLLSLVVGDKEKEEAETAELHLSAMRKQLR